MQAGKGEGGRTSLLQHRTVSSGYVRIHVPMVSSVDGRRWKEGGETGKVR